MNNSTFSRKHSKGTHFVYAHKISPADLRFFTPIFDLSQAEPGFNLPQSPVRERQPDCPQQPTVRIHRQTVRLHRQTARLHRQTARPAAINGAFAVAKQSAYYPQPCRLRCVNGRVAGRDVAQWPAPKGTMAVKEKGFLTSKAWKIPFLWLPLQVGYKRKHN